MNNDSTKQNNISEGATTAPEEGVAKGTVEVSEGPESVEVEIPKKSAKFPGWIDLLSATGVFVFSVLIAAFVASILMRVKGVESYTPDISFVCYLVQMLPVVAFLMWRRYKAGLSSGVFWGATRVNLPMVLWGVVLLLASGVVIEPLLELFPAEPYEAVQQALGLGGWTILSVVVAAPLLEEVLFRGVVFESCRERFGSAAALFISAFLFGLIHVVPVQVVNAFVVGLILGYVYLRTHSLLSVIILHAINNALAYITMAFFGTGAEMTLSELIQVRWLYWVVYGVSALLFVFAMVRLWRTLRDNTEVD